MDWKISTALQAAAVLLYVAGYPYGARCCPRGCGRGGSIDPRRSEAQLTAPLTRQQVLFTADQIRDKTKELGLRVARDYADLRPVICPILKVRTCATETSRTCSRGALDWACMPCVAA